MNTKRVYFLICLSTMFLFNLSAQANDFYKAISRGDTAEAIRLIKVSQDRRTLVNSFFEGSTPLHAAVHIFGRDMNSEDAQYIRPPYYHLDIFSILLSHGANLETRDSEGLSPIGLAYQLGYRRLGDRLRSLITWNDLTRIDSEPHLGFLTGLAGLLFIRQK